MDKYIEQLHSVGHACHTICFSLGWHKARADSIIDYDPLQLAVLWPIVVDWPVLCGAVIPENDRTLCPVETTAEARLFHMSICDVGMAPVLD